MTFSAKVGSQPQHQTRKGDCQRQLERRPVSKGVTEPVTEPVKTSGVTKRGVGHASPGLNAEGVPPSGGEGDPPSHRECENGGWVKGIPAQDDPTGAPRKQDQSR